MLSALDPQASCALRLRLGAQQCAQQQNHKPRHRSRPQTVHLGPGCLSSVVTRAPPRQSPTRSRTSPVGTADFSLRASFSRRLPCPSLRHATASPLCVPAPNARHIHLLFIASGSVSHGTVCRHRPRHRPRSSLVHRSRKGRVGDRLLVVVPLRLLRPRRRPSVTGSPERQLARWERESHAHALEGRGGE